jgi:hypothetical protein
MIDRIMVRLSHSAELEMTILHEEEQEEITNVTKKDSGFMALIRDPLLRKNLIAVTFLWTSQSFSYYLVGYYTKYFEGNFFVNYAMLGIADAFSFLYVKLLSHKYDTPKTLRFLLIGVIIGCSFFALLSPTFPALIPVMIILIRMHVSSVLNFGYHINSFLFPILLRGNVFAVTNIVSRPFNALATIVVEYTKDPVAIVLFIATFSIFATLLIQKPPIKIIKMYTPRTSIMMMSPGKLRKITS